MRDTSIYVLGGLSRPGSRWRCSSSARLAAVRSRAMRRLLKPMPQLGATLDQVERHAADDQRWREKAIFWSATTRQTAVPKALTNPRPGKELGVAVSDRVLLLTWILSLVLTGGTCLLLWFL